HAHATETGLRILAADEDRDALEETAQLLGSLGHAVTAYAVGVREAAERIAAEDPDLAVVVLHDDIDHALELIDELSESTAGPVIALCNVDPDFVSAAAERGVDAVADTSSPDAVQSAIEVAMRRHAERRAMAEQIGQLESALERRSVIERAKGIVMERHGVDEREAFGRLRDHARSQGKTVVGVAQAVVDGHALLPKS
ncbi:MAG TPA: ANTAR domain-containing protein, partial [Capillimicrobium sp.]